MKDDKLPSLQTIVERELPGLKRAIAAMLQELG